MFLSSADNTCVNSTELSNFAQAVITAYDAGVIATSDTSSETNWDYPSSLLFALTVITSIGKFCILFVCIIKHRAIQRLESQLLYS